ncbi:MAG: sortase [Rubrobacteraceae bacterium]
MRKTVGLVASLAVVVAGLALVGFFVAQNFNGAVTEGAANGSNNRATTVEEPEVSSVAGPEDNTLSLTVPKMQRIDSAAIPTAMPDEEALRVNAAVRIPGTGLPWEQETNVYIAGHELGYPLTPSFRAFYDLKKLTKGDEVYLTDADGNEYTYEVFEVLIVQPDDLWVLDPLEGRNVVSLQGSETQMKENGITPKRVVRAELVDTTNSSLTVS